ncbi:hypothetical protein ACFVMC_12635 [Nocardia sp. NPDC127579]|uniref:hypothetical protein n=1 Tax=Nocardia sp. NPDC127579 TaxID=3345402 RepID=UPI00363BEB14
MGEWYKGRYFSNREELGLPPLSQEELDDAAAKFAEFNRQRDAVRPEDRVQLSDRFGAHDFDWDDENYHPDGTPKKPGLKPRRAYLPGRDDRD